MTSDDELKNSDESKNEEDDFDFDYKDEERRQWDEYNNPPFDDYFQNIIEIEDYFRVNKLTRDWKGYANAIAHFREDPEKMWGSALPFVFSRIFDTNIVNVDINSYPYSRRNKNVRQNVYVYFIGAPKTHKSTVKYAIDEIVEKVNARLIENGIPILNEEVVQIGNSSPEGIFDVIQDSEKINFDLEESEESLEKSIKLGSYQAGNLSILNRIFYGLGGYRVTVKGGKVQYEKGKYATLMGDAHINKPELLKGFLNSGFARRTLMTVIRHEDKPEPVVGLLSEHYDVISDIVKEQLINDIVMRVYWVLGKTLRFREDAKILVTQIYHDAEMEDDEHGTELPGNVELIIRLSMLVAIFNGEVNDKYIWVSKKNVESVIEFLTYIDPAYQQELQGNQETAETIKEKIVKFVEKKGEVMKRDISNGVKIKDDYFPLKTKSKSKILDELLDELCNDDTLKWKQQPAGNNKFVKIYSIKK